MPKIKQVQLPSFIVRPQQQQRVKRINQQQQMEPNGIALPLLNAIRKPQSRNSRREIEVLIEELHRLAQQQPNRFNKRIQSGSSRTVWSTVTSDSILGTMFQKLPSNVLGGYSWQCISADRTKSENIVYWPNIDLRMVGLARLSPLANKKSNGYSLSISGLEFRWGSKGCPEKVTNNNNSNTYKGSSITLFSLDEATTLGNGVGTLEVLYNDGVVRITKDKIQNNTYIHVKEPLNDELFFWGGV